MSFFQRVGNAMARFMYGRNGGDRLGLVTIWTAIVIDVVCLFIKGYQVPYLILSTLSTAMVLWALWRMFSRNLAKRRAENAWFMSKVCWPVKNAFGLTRTRMRDREHTYIACPQVPDSVPGSPWQGADRHYLPQVPGGDPYQELNRSCCKARFL